MSKIYFTDLHLDSVAVQIGPLSIRWYALSYIAGLLIGWGYCRWLTRRPPHTVSKPQIDDFLLWATLGVVLGGRLGYILFYKPGYYIEHPLEILTVWEGGMAFHGGLVGVILAMILYARNQRLPFFALADIVACATPIGLLLGRLANFVNGELYGRRTGGDWGVVFPAGGPDPRHPSQLYEALLEGVVLFVVMFLLARFTRAKSKLGVLSGAFLIGYGICRIIAELFREPDFQLRWLVDLLSGVTMGQLLSLPMLVMGTLFILWAKPAVK